MADITKIDKNFEVKTIQMDDIKFYNAEDKIFNTYGVFKENGKYRRMPEDVAKKVNPGVYELHTNTAGGRVRFMTDSRYVAIHTVTEGLPSFSHMTFCGSNGYDIYVGDNYKNSFIPPFGELEYEGISEFDSNEMREITINFPLYCNVCELHIGLQKTAKIKDAPAYAVNKPIVFYGSSITQGGCASRPGNCYQNIISRRVDCDYINLGFSGSARAEDTIAEYINNLDMSVFVYDYDHNAPTVAYLENTHEKMFKAVRAANPNLPIVIMSRPKHYLTKIEEEHLEIIKRTYNNARSGGDENVYLLDGKALTKMCKNDGTVDDVHPNDFGFAAMAEALSEVLEKILSK